MHNAAHCMGEGLSVYHLTPVKGVYKYMDRQVTHDFVP